MRERTKLMMMLGIFAACWALPTDNARSMGALGEALALVKWYAREHVLLCLMPAFFIAGGVSVFMRQGAIMKHLGPAANKLIAYPVAAASGTLLAVCSCTVLPLFASVYKRGAGLGPASAFLYSGPAINALAIILTAQVLGAKLGLARAIGAILFSVIIGVLMHLLFHKEEAAREVEAAPQLEVASARAPWQDAAFFIVMVLLLIALNWGPAGWGPIYELKWVISGLLAVLLGLQVWRWFDEDDRLEWVDASWTFAKQIMPLLFAGVLVAGALLGGPEGGEGLIPRGWISAMVGGESFMANLFAAASGAVMYFATLTEVPILSGLIQAGMGEGPALALLLAGPALSLPNMLVIRSVLGTRKTLAFIGLVVALSALAGWVYGAFF